MNVTISKNRCGFFIYTGDDPFYYLNRDGKWCHGMNDKKDGVSAQYIPLEYGIEAAINVVKRYGHSVTSYMYCSPEEMKG